MDKTVKNYLDAWEHKDAELMKQVLAPNFKGIRTYFKEQLYDIGSVVQTLLNKRELSYTLLHTEHQEHKTYVDAYLNCNGVEHLVTLKFTQQNNKIISVYETKKLVDTIRIKCIVSYDGSMFDGYQKQPTKNTVQNAIEDAIFQATKERSIIHSSGRTDKGVHAYNQVFHFDTKSKIEPTKIATVLNSYLPDSIYIKSSMEVHETFHSRYDILSKEYVYIINKKEYDVIKRNYEWYPGEFDVPRFKKELESIVGTHDFTSLTKTNDQDMFRTIFDVEFLENSKYLQIYIKGNGFLRYMVRNLVAAAMNIAKDKLDYTLLELIRQKNNTILKDIAPSSGLYLNEVEYYE